MCDTFCGCVDDVFKNFLYTLNLKKNSFMNFKFQNIYWVGAALDSIMLIY